jgi:hypothetical protein
LVPIPTCATDKADKQSTINVILIFFILFK